jgi:excisionase family DNA binding protein
MNGFLARFMYRNQYNCAIVAEVAVVMPSQSAITIVQEPDDVGRDDQQVGPGRLLGADDVARYIGMTTDWIYREVRAGRMPHIRLGRYVRFRRESIDAWLVARERGPAAVRTRSR